MSRNISPPPSKRRKITTIPSQEPKASIPVPELLPPLDADSIHIFSWNINGITPFLQKPITSFFKPSKAQNTKGPTPTASLRTFLHRHAWPSILFLQEVKISPTDTKIQDAVRAAINAKLPSEENEPHGPTYEAHFTLPTDLHNARGIRGSRKVYGVCSILSTNLRERYKVDVRTVNWDNEGRVSVVEIVSQNSKLAIFNIYAVNGTNNPYREPTTGAVDGTRHDRKRAFHRLLMRECVELEREGWSVLLGGDMNVALDARDGYPKLRTWPLEHVGNRVDFKERLLGEGGEGETFKGMDVWRQLHGEERRYTYFPRGREWGTSCDRVDYFVAGRGMWEGGLVRGCGILDSEGERGTSDHCPIWVDVGVEAGDGD
ncbi:DNase I-like protein [Ophiobolus disseminans]|uniref:DNase I-like protein n=1 Tax=Ophiobolus disseminans TaxID=1469910 RepID=A0A6A6ZP03_9PLEO|nr:DNase I-like protein [Ophiobolus disseminans]